MPNYANSDIITASSSLIPLPMNPPTHTPGSRKNNILSEGRRAEYRYTPPAGINSLMFRKKFPAIGLISCSSLIYFIHSFTILD